MIRIVVLITLFYLLCFDSNCQSIHKTWLSDKYHTCIEFDSVSKDMSVGPFYLIKHNEHPNFKYKLKNDKIKIVWYDNQTIFGYGKEVNWLKIETLTENYMTLQFLGNYYDKALVELFGDTLIQFRQLNMSCREYYKDFKK